ncbi:hypothetical protein [Nonomuraea sp. NPDC049480]
MAIGQPRDIPSLVQVVAHVKAAGSEVDLIIAFGDAMTWNKGLLPTSV